MVSRLDRLFILLETGSSEPVRLAAAKQLGEVQRIQPHDLDYLLRRIKEYSSKSLWETRIAAGHATRCVIEQLDSWPPASNYPIKQSEKFSCKQEVAQKLIEQHVNTEQTLLAFDLDRVLESCPKLVSMDALETNNEVKPSGSRGARGRKESIARSRKSTKDQLIKQRQLINKELGISDSLNLGVRSTDIISNDDLQTEYNTDSSENSGPLALLTAQQQDAIVILKECFSNYKNIIGILLEAGCIQEPSSDTSCAQNGFRDILSWNAWPLNDITQEYSDNLLNPSWEIRHGAAIALREIVKLQGNSAGKRAELNENLNNALNQLWLIDTALRAICVLALDKFGDFLFDQVVAPVRENTAQLVGCCISKMDETNAVIVLKLLLKMLEDTNWETRHGGILGLKYSLSVLDGNFAKKALQFCFDPIFKCLGDMNDDVSAESAASLVPVKHIMIETIPDKAPELIKFLWEHLADLDELTTSTSNIILLLASLITSSFVQVELKELIESIPKLWPLLSHSSTTVRTSALKALITLLKLQSTSCLQWMPDQLYSTAMRLIFQRSILENMEEVHCYIDEVWGQLIRTDLNEDKAQVERLNLLKSTSQYLNYWFCLTMQPTNIPIDRGNSLWLNIRADGTKSCEKPEGEIYICSSTFSADATEQQKIQLTKCRLLGTKLLGSLYASLTCDIEKSQHSSDTLKYLSEMFVHYLKTKSANQRLYSGWAIESWAGSQVHLLHSDLEELSKLLPEILRTQMNSALQETTLCYDELAADFTRLQQEAREFVAALVAANLGNNLTVSTDKRALYNLNQIQSLCNYELDVEHSKQASQNFINSPLYKSLVSKKNTLIKTQQATRASQKSFSVSVLSSLACAQISWRLLPGKLKLISEPLLDSIEAEEVLPLQSKSVNYLIVLLDKLCEQDGQQRDLIDDIIRRLVESLYLSSNLSISENYGETTASSAATTTTTHFEPDTARNGPLDRYKIVLLDNLQRKDEMNRATSRRQSSALNNPILKRSHSQTAPACDPDRDLSLELVKLSWSSKASNDIKVRGIRSCLSKIVSHFGDNVPKQLPKLWASITSDIKDQIGSYCNLNSVGDEYVATGNKLARNLTLLQVVGQSVSIKLRYSLLELLPSLIQVLSSENPLIRHQGAQCIGLIAKLMLNDAMEVIYRDIIPMLDIDDKIFARCGAIETIALIIEHLQLDLVPKINMFIVHVLRRMSDQNDQVRLMATHCFGKLLSLMPLNVERDKNSNESKLSLAEDSTLIENNDENFNFIEQLLEPKKLRNLKIPFEMGAELRSYQQDGLNWLAFLNRFNLHGILCDEMGLGKTLMTICMVASDHFQSSSRYNIAPSTDSPKPLPTTTTICQLPSLIVCPATLTEHWLYEIEKFIPIEIRSILNPVTYAGSQMDRQSLRQFIAKTDEQLCEYNEVSERVGDSDRQQKRFKGDSQAINLVVASYDVVRNDIDFFKSVHWNYCVLDEGHIIKNGKTKLSRAIRLLYAKHRLILSGTPIQNNVTELWSLFDFLMPGFLGSERQFNSRFTKPILQSREPKCSPKELESGALAMESLHRQVLPFILRRLKQDVLNDLPPKIIQDYYCELSPLQMKLYEDFTKSKLCNTVTKKALYQLDAQEEQVESSANSKRHVFQALQYLRSVCNHPKIVLTDKHTKYAEIKKSLDSEKISLDDISHSSKLKALKQLLIDCGIGIASQTSEEPTNHQQPQQAIELESVVNQHRALVFCQHRSMVDIIENDLLKKHLPSTTYLRLDGSIPPNQRQPIVSRFNNDPSIDILLLTTQIGGLGLNLTGADTVIFVEHDWNPTRDLQAMDRAHRIGQKKVVNVYRLITKNTLEERIMGLQKFKTKVSNTVINQDNTGLGTMKVDQLLDLFDDNKPESNVARGGSSQYQDTSLGSGGGAKSSSPFVDLLPELWDQQQYETEYDLSNFVSTLKN